MEEKKTFRFCMGENIKELTLQYSPDITTLLMHSINYMNNLMSASSFVNSLNEFILIPKYNVFFGLNGLETEEDFLTKIIYKLSYYGAGNHWDKRYSPIVCSYINHMCNTNFTYDEIYAIYGTVGNSMDDSREFVRSGFSRDFLNKMRDKYHWHSC